MNNNSITFDIETVPQRSALSEIQAEELQKRLSSFLDRNPDRDEEDAKSLLMGTSPYFGEIVCIGVHKKTATTDRTISLIGDEKDILIRFWDIIANFKGVFVSFNGKKFDVPFIIKRSIVHGVESTNKKFHDTYPFKNFPHYDVWQALVENRGEAVSLRLACDVFGVPSPKEEGIKASEVAQAYEDGRIQEISDYCIRDVVATYKVYKKISGHY